MISVPRQRASLQWHQQLSWRRYAESLFRLISRRRDFRLEFRVGQLIAGVLPEQGRVIINPALLNVPAFGVRFDPHKEEQQRVFLLRGLMAHEAGHVVFSAAKPAEKNLGWLWNALEDERMERLVMRRFPELVSDFDFLGDVMLLGGGSQNLDLMNACLVWRWAHDRRDVPFSVKADAQEAWEQVRPLVEEAWETTRERVEVMAAQILAFLPDDPSVLLPELGADGGGMSGEQPEEQAGSQESTHPETGAPENAESDTQTPDSQGANGDNEAHSTSVPEGAEPKEETDEECVQGRPADSGPPEEGPDGRDGDDQPHGAATQKPGPQHGGNAPREPLPAPPTEQGRAEVTQQLTDIEGYARTLAPILAPPGRPAHQSRHRSRGRFQYDRYQQGAEQYFRRKVGEDKPAPFLLRLLVDLSGSMDGVRLDAAKDAALMLARAAHLSGSRLHVIGFQSTAFDVVTPEMSWEESTLHIGGMRAGGFTFLSSALETALGAPKRPEEQEVLAIICDGQLTGRDVTRCHELLGKERRMVVPVLIGDGTTDVHTWETVFGFALAVHNVDDIARTLKSTLGTLRARMSR